MKLLFCKNCHDIFNLANKLKTCSCGNTKGKYIDNINAIYFGKQSIPLGFDNFSFTEALKSQPLRGDGYGFIAFVIPKECKTYIKEKKGKILNE
jgi:hypothetical protein